MLIFVYGGDFVNNRVRQVREALSINQSDFGNKIGIGQAGVSAIEKGIRGLTDRNILLICEKFNVNEVWLRTGEGGDENMFNEVSDEDEYSLNLGKLTISENEFIQNTVKFLANAEPKQLEVIESFMMTCLGLTKKEE